LLQEIQYLVKNAKLISIFIVMSTILYLLTEKINKFGNVNFAFLKIKYKLKMRKNPKIKL